MKKWRIKFLGNLIRVDYLLLNNFNQIGKDQNLNKYLDLIETKFDLEWQNFGNS